MMNKKIIELLKEKPIIIPKILLQNYKKLKISEEELLVIAVIMSYGNKVMYDPELFAGDIDLDKKIIMKCISSLCDKSIASLVIEKRNQRAYEYITLDSLYDKLFNIVADNNVEEEIDTSVFSIFESELGRTLSPMEYEKIKEWVGSNSQELIVLALREAVLNGVNNLNYIDKILDSWKKKGYKTKHDVMNDKEKYKAKREKVEVYETDWLNSDE